MQTVYIVRELCFANLCISRWVVAMNHPSKTPEETPRKITERYEKKMFRDKIFYGLFLRKYIEQRKRKKRVLPSILSMLQSITIERKEVQIDLDSWYYFSPDALESRLSGCCNRDIRLPRLIVSRRKRWRKKISAQPKEREKKRDIRSGDISAI